MKDRNKRLITRCNAGMRRMVVGVFLLFFAGSTLHAPAAVLVVGDYTFDGDLNNSAGAGFQMSAVGGSGSYSSADPFGQTKKVLQLTGTQGLTIDTTDLTSQDAYTVVMDINTVQVGSFNAMLHVDTSDDWGFYIYQNDIWYYNDPTLQTSSDFMQSNQWYRLAVTRDIGGTICLYAGEANSGTVTLRASGIYGNAEPIQGNSIQLFKDNATTENYGISVSRVLLGDGAMTLEEINNYRPDNSSVPEPSSFALLLMAAFFVRGIARRKTTKLQPKLLF